VLFLVPANDGVLHVTALSQGHFPLRADNKGIERLIESPRLSKLIGQGTSAVRRLVGRSVVEADDLVRRAEQGND
jgi:hypothetical protein